MSDKYLGEIEGELEKICQGTRKRRMRNSILISFIKSTPATTISSITIGLTVFYSQKQFNINSDYSIYPFIAAGLFIILGVVSWFIASEWDKRNEVDKVTKRKLRSEFEERVERAKGKFEESPNYPPLSSNYQGILFDENMINLNKLPKLMEDYGEIIVRDMSYIDKELVDKIDSQRDMKDLYFKDIIDFTREARQQLESMAKVSEMEVSYFSKDPPVTMSVKIRALLLAYLYEINQREFQNTGLTGKDLEFFALLLQKDPSYEKREKYPLLMKMEELKKMARKVEQDRIELKKISIQIDEEIGSKFLGNHWKKVVFS